MVSLDGEGWSSRVGLGFLKVGGCFENGDRGRSFWDIFFLFGKRLG